MKNVSTDSTTTDEQPGLNSNRKNDVIPNPNQLPRRSSLIASQVTQGSHKSAFDPDFEECPIPSQVPRLECSEQSLDIANLSPLDHVKNVRPAIEDDHFGVNEIPYIDKMTHKVVKISRRPNSTYDKLQWIG